MPARRPGNSTEQRPAAAGLARRRAGDHGTPAGGQVQLHQLASQAAHLLRDSGRPPCRHVVDESQDLHPAQWRLLRAAVAPGPDDLFIAGEPHQRIYGNRISLTGISISIRGRSRRLTLRERCLPFVACTRARDHLYVSYSGQPRPLLPQRHFE